MDKSVDAWDITPALDMIKSFEGCSLDAYLDPVGIPTIGWGTTVYPPYMGHAEVEMGETITQAQADEYLLFEVDNCRSHIRDLVDGSLTNNQMCALVSFAYNLGIGALSKSTLLRKLNGGAAKSEVAHEFEKWINAGGKPLKGLIRRRQAEKALFLT